MSSDIRPRFAGRLRDALAASGLTQRELAERARVNFRTLQEWLSGRSRMPAEALPGVAEALGVSCDYLATGEPASLDPAALWAALEKQRTVHAWPEPVTEELVHSLYYEYTWHYLLLRLGREQTQTVAAQADRLTKAFTDKVESDHGTLMTMLRRKASGG